MKRILAAMLSMLLLCSCGYFSSGNAQNLLVAPRLNKRQVALDVALKDTINVQRIVYKYPQTGDFRSPFVFHDLDGDGKEEAVVFYAYADDPSNIRFKVLAERVDGSWYSVHDFPGTGDGDQINFIDFASLLDPDQQCMIIGWQNTVRGRSYLGVYSYSGSSFTKEIVQPYILWDMSDYNKDGLSEIAVVSWMVSEETGLGDSYYLTLLAKGMAGGISDVSSIQLSMDTTAVLQMMHGSIWDNTTAIYLDVLMPAESTSEIATMVVQVQGDDLEVIVGENSMGLFADTKRVYQDQPALCVDLERDGVVEVPSLLPLSGQVESREIDELMLTSYLHLNRESFEQVSTGVVNHDDGYVVFFPERWSDTVTVTRLPEIREWQFYYFDSQSDRAEAELLRIQVFSTLDYRDKFTENYNLLGKKGQLEYYAYIPQSKDAVSQAVTLAEVERMFRLL